MVAYLFAQGKIFIELHGNACRFYGLEDIEQWSSALAGHDAVIHAAAPVLVWGEWELFYKQIVQATKQLYDAGATYGVKRFIFISSESVLQEGAPLLDIDETKAYPKEPNSYYGKAKMLAEQMLLQSDGPECVIIRPTFMWGEGNRGLQTIVQRVRDKKFVWVDHGVMSMEMVHVDNVVEALMLSLTHGRHKQIYFVTDDHPMPVHTFLAGVFEAAGAALPRGNIPGWLARPLAAGIETVWRTFGIKSTPPLSRFQLDLIALPRRYNIHKIKEEMGYRPVITYAEGVQKLTGTIG